MSDQIDNPLEGKGEEMLPDRGLPKDGDPTISPEMETFLNSLENPDELESNQTVEEVLPAAPDEPRDLTPVEVAAISEEALPPDDAGPVEPVAPDQAEMLDSGHNAIDPMLTEAEVAGLPSEPVPLPAIESTMGAPYLSEESLLPPGPTGNMPGSEPLPGSEDLEAKKSMIALLVTEPQLQGLWDRADQIQEQVNQKINSLPLARQLLDNLQRARNEILAGKDRYEEAERALSEVEYRVAFSQRVEKWSYSLGMWLLLYELLWGVLIALGMLYLPAFVQSVVAKAGVDASSALAAENVHTGITSILWGSLGGMVGALYALWRHVARDQDFSKQYAMWYITNPIMGLTLGAFVFLAVRAGMLSLTAGATAQTISSAFTIYLMAWIVGFQQNVALDIVRRILRVFRIGEEPSDNSTTAITS